MRRKIVYIERYPRAAEPYGVLDFIGDSFMIFVTGGLWLVWIFVREMRKR